ncbi:Stk1 family PASTA domain-containing Ser/Thr kinase [Blastococcus sp. TF02A-26]|uniref:Stk1 family PASTA domain-containing Ser/Thr kinase n=1 Tax=Blastococcus sp. TF02A-26 TaxID=2250577 RepID=UPI000DEADD9A|nr:Stk1 family PASTA domain-containing Ser/Thr kinase [Blastococcus sp. TF02A-26]RBY88672.1 Stk1 family PASTA domain-containing Ser/Thr kinase [Blastococcus sp. TF02A-26]
MTTPQVLGERYEIGGVLGRGGMAEVHRGRDTRLGREVAVKVLRSDLARDPSFQVRFRREAQAAASLNHPAIVAVYDTGEDRSPSGNTPYIVMEYVEGETLRDVLRREGVLAPERAMSLAADICGALDFSHRNGIVHRDVKPGNVMITPAGSVKVMDFGIARAVSDSAATMTSTAAVIGTAQYLSPEQARGEGVDARSDVYSLGCLLYELVTGAPPFTGDSPVSVAYQHVREDPRLPSSINPAISPELDSILLKAMSKNPANRYQSAAEMRNDLLRALAGQRVEATPVMGEAERTAVIGAVPPVTGRGRDDWDDDDDEQAAARRKRNRIIAAVVGALVLIGAVVGIALAMGGDDEDGGNQATATVSVPTLVDLPRADAEAAIQTAGLTVGDVTEQEVDDPTRVGVVLDSRPGSGAQVEEGSEVDLTVGIAPDSITIPAVINLSEEDARAALEAARFTGNINRDEVDSLEPEGTVVDVDPAQRTAVAPDTTITLFVSDGDAPVPSVSGDQASARQQLVDAGFTNITPQEVEDPAPAGTVLGTTPPAGTSATAATEIVLRVSSGPAQPTTVPVPNVVDQTEQAATTALQGQGFVVRVVDAPAADPADVGIVIAQSPTANNQVARGSSVTITVGREPADG